MKRIISLLMCVVMVCSMFAVTVNAAENHYDEFDSEIMKLWWSVAYSGEDNIYDFSPKHIKWYTLYKINIYDYDSYEIEKEYSYGSEIYTYTIRYYQIPADVFESQASKHFNISDINVLRNDKDHEPCYNAETNTYDMPDAGGFGDSVTYVTKGYKDLGNGKYEVYGYTVEQAYEKPDGAVEGVDYIIMPDGDYPAEILKCLKVTVEYNGKDVKFLSWETSATDKTLSGVFVLNPDISYCKGRIVYITSSGEKYHASSLCSNMKNPIAKKLSDAKSLGYTACSKCVTDDFEAGNVPHTISSWITDQKATVTAAGKRHKECSACGKVFETATIEQLICSKPKLKTISNTEYGVKITWGKVSGADKYRVYRKTSKSDWEYIGSTTKTYYTDKTAKSGTKYYYAVKARNSSLSSSLSKYYLADPTLKAPSSTKSGVSLKWTKTAGAQGYIIYRKTGSGSFTKLKTEKGVSNLSYVDKSAKKGKKYTYKVKAYYSKTYSAYSNTKTIKDKY